ncbi:MAG TPA: nucleotidyl transferase AbiEii/AbiGii toxin family protein [Nitrososphaerales archaeon]|nr:nucleotidyl transferase AbiEii/AbiGii toxin family protein [Nitrososphaerales archaeon]
MSAVPLGAKLRRRTHKSVALAQDILMTEAYNAFPDAVLHGGTAIWRCYGGGRFSEDLDIYLPQVIAASTERLRRGAVAKGLAELKFKETASTLSAKFSLGGTVVSFEAAKRAPPTPSVVKPYAMVDGNLMLVRTLSPESLLVEKAAAYASRRKVRDLYDAYFLLGLVGDKTSVTGAVDSLVYRYRPPVDEAQLRAIVVVGAVPSAEAMVGELRRWARRST